MTSINDKDKDNASNGNGGNLSDNSSNSSTLSDNKTLEDHQDIPDQIGSLVCKLLFNVALDAKTKEVDRTKELIMTLYQSETKARKDREGLELSLELSLDQMYDLKKDISEYKQVKNIDNLINYLGNNTKAIDNLENLVEDLNQVSSSNDAYTLYDLQVNMLKKIKMCESLLKGDIPRVGTVKMYLQMMKEDITCSLPPEQ